MQLVGLQYPAIHPLCRAGRAQELRIICAGVLALPNSWRRARHPSSPVTPFGGTLQEKKEGMRDMVFSACTVGRWNSSCSFVPDCVRSYTDPPVNGDMELEQVSRVQAKEVRSCAG